MDGLDFLRAIREDSDVPFIVFTGKGKEVAIEALNSGADNYFQKIRSREKQASVLGESLIKIAKNRKMKERNELLETLVREDLREREETIRNLLHSIQENLQSLKKAKMSSKAKKMLKKSLGYTEDALKLSEGRKKKGKSKSEKAFVKVLNKSLGFAYWTESQLEEDLWDVYKEMGSHKKDFLEITKRGGKSKSLIEEIAESIERVELEKSAEHAEIKSSSFGKKDNLKILRDLAKRENSKVEMYEKLQSSSENDMLDSVWNGEDLEEFFKKINTLLKRSKKNLQTLKDIGKKEFSDKWTEPSGGLSPDLESIKSGKSKVLKR